MATQSLMLSMQQRESTRLLERAVDKNSKYLIMNLFPKQQYLFLTLCTSHMHKSPTMSPFLTLSLAEKAPHRGTRNKFNHSRNTKMERYLFGFRAV